MASWATVLLREINLVTPPKGISMHADEIRRKITRPSTWKLSDKEASNTITEFVKKFGDSQLRDKECIGYMIKFAIQKAAEIEDKVKREKQRDWQSFVAGNN